MDRTLDRTARYTSVAIAFHWSIAALIVFNLAVGLLHEPVPALRALMPAHKAVGITVLALTLLRVLWRLAHRPPPLPAGVPAAERHLAKGVHWTLYALMVAMPLTGWAMVSGAPRGVMTWFGLFPLPYLPVSTATSSAGHGAHTVLGWLMLALVVLHVAAALRHHLVLRDGVLVRMAPALAGSQKD